MKYLISFLMCSILITSAQDNKTEVKEPAKKAIPIDKAKVEDLIKQLGADGFRNRRNAKKALMAMGYKVAPILKAALAKNKDPEVTTNIKEIIKPYDGVLFDGQLTKNQLALIKKGQFTPDINGNNISGKVKVINKWLTIYTGNNCFVFQHDEKRLNSSTNFTLYTVSQRWGGSSSSSDGDFTIYSVRRTGNGAANWTVANKSFTVDSGIVKLKSVKTALVQKNLKFHFFDKDSNFLGTYTQKEVPKKDAK